MGFLGNTKGSLISEMFKLKEDMANLNAGEMHNVVLFEDRIELKPILSKRSATLKYEQITDIFYGKKTEVSEKNKSVIGRAIVGGVLLGGLGAVIGAVSGAGSKQSKTTKPYLIISYKNVEDKNAFIILEDTRGFKGKKLSNKLAEKCGLALPSARDVHL